MAIHALPCTDLHCTAIVGTRPEPGAPVPAGRDDGAGLGALGEGGERMGNTGHARTSARPSLDDDRRALDDLDRAFGNDYDLAVTDGSWIACELRTCRWLVASCAAELRRLIEGDAADHGRSAHAHSVPSPRCPSE